MSISITIRNVPVKPRHELAARPAQSGRSLQEYLRARLIALARQPDAETLVDRARARKAVTTALLTPDQILGHRDAGRR